jgi:hypothetical protein
LILSYNQVKQYLRNAGFKGINLEAAIKICYCESSFNTTAHNTSGEDSRGLMQINLEAHPHLSHLDLFNPEINTQAAYQIFSSSGKDFSDWTCAKQLGLINPGEIYFYLGISLMAGIVLYST